MQANARSRRGRHARNLAANIGRRLAHLEYDGKLQMIKPPLDQPVASDALTCNMRIGLAWVAAPTPPAAATKTYRVEDVIKGIKEVFAMSDTWDPLIAIQIQRVQVYALLDKSTAPLAKQITLGVWNPLTNSLMKRVIKTGDIDDPPRVGFHYPSSVHQTTFTWDGSPASSGTIVDLETFDPAYVRCYVDVVVRIRKDTF